MVSNWTKTPPTRPGAYWWRHNGEDDARPVHVIKSTGKLLVSDLHPVRELAYLTPAEFGGEWRGPLVLVEEVEKAWHEGHSYGKIDAAECKRGLASWHCSRAKKVMEGKL